MVIKKDWCQHPSFAARVADLSAAVSFSELSVPEESRMIKFIYRDAAKYARNIMLVESPADIHNVMLRLSSISRCVWSKDSDLANTLLTFSELARTHLYISPCGLPTLKDPAVFENVFRENKLQHLDSLKQHVKTECELRNLRCRSRSGFDFNVCRKNERLEHLNQLQELWLPKAPRIVLASVRVSDEAADKLGIDKSSRDSLGNVLASGAHDMLKAFADAWGNVFQEQPIDEPLAQRIAEEYSSRVQWDWSTTKPVNRKAVANTVSRLLDTACGRDGIPNAAWRGGGEIGINYLSNLTRAHLGNNPRPHDINEGETVFIPKGQEDDDGRVFKDTVFRAATETRPLTLKNSDNKIVAAVANYAISPTIQKCASVVQNGFVHGRQLAQNIVDLDHASRVYACRGHSVKHPFDSVVASNESFCLGQVPVTVPFDFAAAFPSVVHAWLFIVIRYIKMPEGLQRLIKALYENNQAYGTIEGQCIWLFAVCGGVLQGCPLSGSLFVLAIDPLLYLFSHYLHSADRGRVRACADGIGIALRKLAYLKHIYW